MFEKYITWLLASRLTSRSADPEHVPARVTVPFPDLFIGQVGIVLLGIFALDVLLRIGVVQRRGDPHGAELRFAVTGGEVAGSGPFSIAHSWST